MNVKQEKGIAAIQTRYKGYHFRSRHEARWAVFFDALGLDWSYEVEGYDLGDLGWYLPDFVVTSPYGDKHFYEVKQKDSKEGKEKLERLIKSLGVTGSMLIGDPTLVTLWKFEKFNTTKSYIFSDNKMWLKPTTKSI